MPSGSGAEEKSTLQKKSTFQSSIVSGEISAYRYASSAFGLVLFGSRYLTEELPNMVDQHGAISSRK